MPSLKNRGTPANGSQGASDSKEAQSVAPAAAAAVAGGGAVTTLLTAFWYGSSMLAITTSKMTMQALKVPLVLCTAQFFTATLVAGFLLSVQGSAMGLRRKELTVIALISVTYTLGFIFTNMAFSLANASFVETVKSGEPISTVILAMVLLGERETTMTYASMVPVVVGVAMASSGEAAGVLAAWLATLVSNLGFSARAVFAKALKSRHQGCPAASSDVCLFFHISWMGFFGLLPLAASQELQPLQAALSSAEFDAPRFLGVMALNGLMYTAYNQLSFMVLSRVTTATHAVLNVTRRVCVIGATTIVFGTPLSMFNMTGIGIAVVGMLCFSHSKTRVSKPRAT